jgi:hypothetical protein
MTRGRTTTSEPTSLVHYVVSMDIILTTSPKSHRLQKDEGIYEHPRTPYPSGCPKFNRTSLNHHHQQSYTTHSLIKEWFLHNKNLALHPTTWDNTPTRDKLNLKFFNP